MIPIREFVPADILVLAPHAAEPEIANADPADLLEMARYHNAAGVAYTGVLDGKPVFAAGVHYRGGGRGNVWLIVHKDCRKFAKSLVRSVEWMIRFVVDECGYTRLRTNSDPSFPPSQRLLKALGFVQARRLLVGRHHYLYTRSF